MTTKTTRESVLKEITDSLETLCLDYMADCNHNLENNKPSPPIWEYLKKRLASTPPPAKSLASVKTPNQHEQKEKTVIRKSRTTEREQALRKSIESILFANGVKCDEEQFLIEDIEHLLATCITPVSDTAHCSKAGEQAKKYKKLYKILTVMVREVGATAITINKWQEVENEIEHLLEKEREGGYLEGVKMLEWRINCDTLISELSGWKGCVDMAVAESLGVYKNQLEQREHLSTLKNSKEGK